MTLSDKVTASFGKEVKVKNVCSAPSFLIKREKR